jgi:4-hydroxybenzoate polyprenyltransferase
MTTAAGSRPPTVVGLVEASHPGPALAVTVLAGLLAAAAGLDAGEATLVVVAVGTGQLSVGWCNDLVDAPRDRQVGRSDKPLATGAVGEPVVRAALVGSVVATVVASLLCGVVAGLVQLALVASAWTYNLGLKSTVFSWVPYAFSFGGLPVFVELAGTPAALPPVWLPVAGALLGVGAHIVNVLPDLADDAATGVRGMPHRLGARLAPVLAVVVLVAASVTVAVGASRDGGLGWAVLAPALVLVGGLATVALVGRGRWPFLAAIGIALVDVVLLVVAR